MSILNKDTDLNKETDDLVSSLFNEKKEIYKLPIQVGISGKSLNEGDKPWIVGHFSPGIATDKNHPKGHNGVDLKAIKGTTVYPIASGVVKHTGAGSVSGNYVMCLHEDGKVQSFYGHLESISCSIGQKITQTTKIGTVGETGNAKGRGAHLHYEVKINGSLTDPLKIPGKIVGSLSGNSIKKTNALYDICNNFYNLIKII